MGRKKNKKKCKQHVGSPSHTAPRTGPPQDEHQREHTAAAPISDPVQLENERDDTTQPVKNKLDSTPKAGFLRGRWEAMSLKKKQKFLEASVYNLERDHTTQPVKNKLYSRRKAGFHGENWKTMSVVKKQKFPDLTPIRECWKEMSDDMKKEFLKVKVHDLKAYFKLLPHESKVIDRAISFFKWAKTWNAWGCPICHKDFIDNEALSQHLWGHLQDGFPILNQDRKVDSRWEEMLLDGSWKPVDFDAAMNILLQDWKNQQEVDDVLYPTLSQLWPSSNNPECAQHLEKIHGMFLLLLKNKLLAASHIENIILYTEAELRRLMPDLKFPRPWRLPSPVCICFLGATQLRNVLSFLEDLWSPDWRLTPRQSDDTRDIDTLVSEAVEEISLSGDSSHLILNECLWIAGIISDRTENAGMDDGSKASVICDDGGPDSDAFLSWLFRDPSRQAIDWIQQMKAQASLVSRFRDMLELELANFTDLYGSKSQFELCMSRFPSILRLFLKEHREKTHRRFESLLREKQKELMKTIPVLLRKQQDDAITSDEKNEIKEAVALKNVISSVLKEAEALKSVMQSGQPVVTSHFSDFLSVQTDDWINWLDGHDFNEADKIIILGMQVLKENLFMKISQLDARMRQKSAAVQELVHLLGTTCAIDFQEPLLSRVKAFFVAQLKVKRAADAAESLLTEIKLEKKDNKDKVDSSKKKKMKKD